MALPVDSAPEGALETLEIELLLEGIYRRYGFDFREYAPASLRRRLHRRMAGERVATVSALQERILHDPAVMERLLLDLSVNVTAMFRDPAFFLAFRSKVVPLLRTYPFTRVWVAAPRMQPPAHGPPVGSPSGLRAPPACLPTFA